MQAIWTILLSLGLSLLLLTSPGEATSHNLPDLIEGFVVKQFPDAASHFWVINAAQWQEDDELLVDFIAIVLNATGQPPTENRYLILIVSGQLVAAQHIPLDATTECQPDRT